MSKPIRGHGGIFVSPIGINTCYTNLVGDYEIMHPFKFHLIPFSSFREVGNVLADNMPGMPSWLCDRPEITNWVEDVEILLPGKCR